MQAELPRAYGHTRLVLLAVDPFHVHAYWEMTLGDRVEARERFGAPALEEPEWVLRFYDVTHVEFDGTNARGTFDIPVQPSAQNWYVELWSAEKTYFAELGLCRGAEFVPVCRSNVVHVPRAAPPRAAPRAAEAAGETAIVSPEAGAAPHEPIPPAAGSEVPQGPSEVSPPPSAVLAAPSLPEPAPPPPVSAEEYARFRAESARAEVRTETDGTSGEDGTASTMPFPAAGVEPDAARLARDTPSAREDERTSEPAAPSRSVSLTRALGSGSSGEHGSAPLAGGSGGG
jgi:hypothetical protein